MRSVNEQHGGVTLPGGGNGPRTFAHGGEDLGRGFRRRGRWIDQDVLNVLATANIHSPEDLIKTPIEAIATTTGIDMGDLARLRQRAISWLSEVSS